MKASNRSAIVSDILSLSKECQNGLQEKIKLLVQCCDTDFNERERVLQAQVLEEIEKRHERDRILQSQAKMAAMGEMMDAVAHQWKQPLNALSMYVDLLKMDFDAKVVNKTYIEQFVTDMQEQIAHMVSTIDEFRTFFRPDKEKEPFGLKRCTQSTLLLIHDEMLRNNITVSIESETEIIVEGIENEFKHLLLNLLSNAKDAFIDNGIGNRNIIIRFCQNDASIAVEVEDTAGGIPEAIIGDIFKPNFTTKPEGKGTGIGLYMSMQIAQKMHGTLHVENTEHGAKFTLEIPKCQPQG